MSDNKGKDGEMITARALCEISLKENKCDFTRDTITNTPDKGADLIFHCPSNTGDKLTEIAEKGSSNITLRNDKTEVRIDVKSPEDKVQKDDAKKFISDIRKHPSCEEHWLVGGNNLTGPARKYIDQNSDWANIRYFSKQSINTIENYYRSLPESGKDSEK